MGKSIKLLIVEDSENDAALLIRTLQRGGYEPDYEIVETPEAMADALNRQEWDLVISDYLMPLFSGLDALKLLQEKDPDLSFILMSGHVGEDVAVEAMKAGAHDSIPKSNPGRLIPVVEKELRDTRARRENRQNEQALRESRELYRLIVEIANEGIWQVDEENRTTFVNQKMAEMLGYTIEEIMGQTPDTLMDEEWSKVAKANRPRKGIRMQLEYKYQRKDGTDLWTVFNASPIFHDDGSYAGLISMHTDITKRKRFEGTLQTTSDILKIANRHTELVPLLKESLAYIKNYTRCAAVAIRLLDEEGNMPYHAYEGFSKSFYEKESPLSIIKDKCMCINVITGTTDPDQPFYTNGGSFYMNDTTRFRATVSEEDKGQTRNVCNQVGYESVALIPIRTRDRILGLVHIADPREDMVPHDTVEMLERTAMLLSTAIERVQAQEALDKSETQLRLITDNMFDMITQTDPQGLVQYASPSYKGALGYASEDRLGKPVYSNVHPDDHEKAVSTYMRCIAFRSAGRLEYRYRHADGHYLWMETVVRPLFDNQGNVAAAVLTSRDITERRQVEEALRESEEKYRMIFNATGTAAVIVEEDTTISLINREFETLSGYSKEEIEGKKSWKEFFTEGYLTNMIRYHNRELKSKGECKDEEVDLRTKLGKIIRILCSAFLTEINGESCALVSFVDITERKQMEEELRNSEKQLRFIMDTVPSIMTYVDSEKRYKYINKAHETWWGVNGKDAQGKHIWKVVGEEAYHKLQVYIDIALSGEQVFFEAELPGENGEKHYFYWAMVPEIDGKGTTKGFISISNDMTEFKAMEQKIAEALEFNQKILEKSLIGIVTHNSSGQLVFDNAVSAIHLGKQEAASAGPVPFRYPFNLPLKRLTGRELEVLQHMAEGLSNQEIAELFGVTLRTVKAHASNLFTKLMAKNRVQAVLRGRKLGILPILIK